MISFLNTKTAIKKLQFGPKKCHVLHVGKNHEDYKKFAHYVENWMMQEAQSIQAGEVTHEEAYD